MMQRDQPLPLLLSPQKPSTSMPLLSVGSWSFAQGILIGQLSVLVILGIFLKFFFFGEPDASLKQRDLTAQTNSASRRRTGSAASAANAGVGSATGSSSQAPLSIETLLSKTFYNVAAHQPESLDWVNVLVAQAISYFRHDPTSRLAVLSRLNQVLSGPLKPDFVADIEIVDVNFGEEFPIFSNCKILPAEGNPVRLEAQMDIDLDDKITLAIETKIVLNYPIQGFAVLPISLTASIVRFSGTLNLSLIPTKSPNKNSSFENEDKAGENFNINSGSVRDRTQNNNNVNNCNTSGSCKRNSDRGGSGAGNCTCNKNDNDDDSTEKNSHSFMMEEANKINANENNTKSDYIQAQENDYNDEIAHGPNGREQDEGEAADASGARSEHGSQRNSMALIFYFNSDFRLEFAINSLIGAKSKLQDVPKIENMIESKLRAWFVERCVDPCYQKIAFPNIWPTRAKEGHAGETQSAKRAGAEISCKFENSGQQ